MRNFVFLFAALFTVSAYAVQPDWTEKMRAYRTEIQTWDNGKLFLSQFGNYGRAAVGCTGSLGVTAIAFVSDTIPLTAPVAEWVGNKSNAKYQSYQWFWSWETLANVGRGTAGGALLGGYESMEWVMMWLRGDTEGSFAQLKQAYASSFATLDALFAKESACVSNIVRVAIVRAEWLRRSGKAPVTNFTPMHLQ